MAKKAPAEKINKSAAVREYLKAHPDQGPKVVAETLTAKGIAVTAAYVSTIKTKGDKPTGKKRGRKPGSKNKATRGDGAGNGDVLSVIKLARQFVDAAGGTEMAVGILNVIGSK